MGKFRDGMPVTADAVAIWIDRIEEILAGLEATENEPEATKTLSSSCHMVEHGMAAMSGSAPPIPRLGSADRTREQPLR